MREPFPVTGTMSGVTLHARSRVLTGMLGGVLLPLTGAAQSAWIDAPGVQERLAAGEVVVTTRGGD